MQQCHWPDEPPKERHHRKLKARSTAKIQYPREKYRANAKRKVFRLDPTVSAKQEAPQRKNKRQNKALKNCKGPYFTFSDPSPWLTAAAFESWPSSRARILGVAISQNHEIAAALLLSAKA
jgi:hypothetical protein